MSRYERTLRTLGWLVFGLIWVAIATIGCYMLVEVVKYLILGGI